MLEMRDDLDFMRCASMAGACYVLSTLLYTPHDPEAIVSFRDGLFLDSLEEYLRVLGIEDERGNVAALSRTLHEGDEDEVARTLNVEATRLFSIGFDRPIAPPYESSWREEAGLLTGASTLEVARLYRLNGMDVDEQSHDAVPDHIAREFEFLGHAYRRKALAIDADDVIDAEHWAQAAHDFASRHVSRWVPAWASAVVDSGDSPFFTAVARLADRMAGISSSR